MRKLYKFLENIIFVFLCAIISFNSIICNAQKQGHEFIPSVDAWSFMRYGNTPVDLFTGRICPSIPIYTYKDKDFELPLSIDYACDGFIPNIPTGSVGHGWVLNAGGMISREVRGVPDEYETYQTTTPQYRYLDQFEHYAHDGRGGYFSYYNKLRGGGYNVLRNEYTYSGLPRTYQTAVICFLSQHLSINPTKLDEEPYQRYETTPDIFSFRFLGHKGKFHLHTDNNKIVVYDTETPQGEYEIDMSEFRPMDANAKSSIKIKTGDGYVYTFGGIDKISDTHVDMEYLYYKSSPLFNRRDESQTSFKTEEYTSWLLTSVKAPNGREIKLKYSDPYLVKSIKPGGSYSSFDYYGEGLTSDNLACIQYETRVRNLESIDIDGNCKIEFLYKQGYQENSVNINYGNIIDGDRCMYQEDEKVARSAVKTKVPDKISSISIWDGADNIKRLINLNYTEIGYPNQKTFLNTVSVSGHIYELDYYGKKESFPLNGTISSDYWGYYHGNGRYHIDALNIDFNASAGVNILPKLNVAERQPVFETGALLGMLARIKYPTGGCTYFEYENNSASKKVSREVSGSDNGLPILNPYSLPYINKTFPGSNQVGGVRIKRITDSSASISSLEQDPVPTEDNTNPTELTNNGDLINSSQRVTTVREFSYTHSDGLSSGIVLNIPVYTMFFSRYNHKGGSDTQILTAPNNMCVYTPGESHIQYGRVVETLSDGSYIEYCYSSYEDIEDDVTLYNSESSSWIYSPNHTKMCNYKRQVCSHAMDRGKLRSKKMFHAGGDPVAAEYYIYDYNKELKYTTDLLHTGASTYGHRILTESYPLDKIISTQYFGNKEISKETSFTYNSLGQTTEITTVASNGDSQKTKHLFAKDVTAEDPVASTMVQNNFLSFPIATQTYIKKQDNPYWLLTDALYNNYAYVGSLPLLDKVRKADIKTPYRCDDPPSTVYVRDIQKYRYDSRGNIIQIIDELGLPTTFLWGYGGLLLLAKIENASYERVANFLGDHIIERIANNPQPMASDFDALNAMRGSSGLVNAMVTTYEHIPLTGVSKITDPAGRKITYEYYGDGKLFNVKDDQGNILKQYAYNIAFQFGLEDEEE